MSNTLTGLIPTLYEALDVVSREMVGFIPAVTRNASAERAALNQEILVPITQAQESQDIVAAVTPPDIGDQTVGSVPMTIQKSKMVAIRWNGEQQQGMRSAGTYGATLRDQFAQGFRTLVNEIEVDLFTAAYQSASRAYGTAGTTPFGTAGDMSDLAQLRKILEDNGTPQSDLQFVGGSSATANLRGKQSLLLKVNESGSDALLRRGSISELPIEGFNMHNSGAIKQVTKGTGASYVSNGAVAVGVDTIAVDTGTGTVLAGDVVTFTGDTNKYVVNSALASGSLSIGSPGLVDALGDGVAMAVGNSYTPNVGFARSAVQLIARAPAVPLDENGRPADSAEDSVMVIDPVSGIAFEVMMYRQFRQVAYYVALAWGTKAIKSDHIALLQG